MITKILMNTLLSTADDERGMIIPNLDSFAFSSKWHSFFSRQMPGFTLYIKMTITDDAIKLTNVVACNIRVIVLSY